MLEDYTDKLKMCAHSDEVWALMQNKVYPNSNKSQFSDKYLKVRKNRVSFQDVTPPLGQIGLAYRTVLYLLFDGKMGNAPKNEGCIFKADKLKRVIREISDIQKISIPPDINVELLDTYISIQRKKGLREKSIYQKLYTLLQWKQHNHLLPPFFRITYDLFESSTEWTSLFEGAKREDREYLAGIGGSKEPYPLDQLAIIVTEALEYMEKYANDCVVAAKLYKEVQLLDMYSQTAGNYATKVLRTMKHRFEEPELEKTQQYSLSLEGNSWVPNPKIISPLQSCLDSAHRLQAACVIIVLMITAMRKGELEMMERYSKTKKTIHHELDGSLELERLIYKTAETEKGESHSIAVPPIVNRALYILSTLSEIRDGKQEGLINFMTLNYGKEENNHDRIRYLINSFCDKMNILPPSPHQLRHAMAFLVAFLNDDIGIELAMTLLGHKSIEMTKKYMGHYKELILKTFGVMFDENKQMQEAMTEFQAEQSSSGLEKIIHALEEEEPMAGPVVKRLLQGFEFSGSITDEAKVFFAKSQRLLLERGMLAVVEHPTHFCVRDLTVSEQMPCQIGLSLEDFTNAPVVSAQCQPKCGCKLHTEPQVEYMKELAHEMEDAYPDDLVELLKGNRYYMANSFEQNYTNVIDEFEKAKQYKANKVVENG